MCGLNVNNFTWLCIPVLDSSTLNTDVECCHVLSLPLNTAVSPCPSQIAVDLYLNNFEENRIIK